ncbi:hypothetical protein QWY84_02020 [Aquisalimonas lutea]|uniref:hypothetical protein n=1 Tax=Aquisalimonas lutea TaxID=1327750 RepID=UPI0025B40192|nr:hypothetical protein [Aquisalimonas lutea]MDN3516375.1 hypothetical protein [Aquisalimonas lutea]
MKRFIIAAAIAAAAIGQANAESYNGLLTQHDLHSAGNASPAGSIVAHFRSTGEPTDHAHRGGKLGEREPATVSETPSVSNIAAHFRGVPSAGGNELGRAEGRLIGKGVHAFGAHAGPETAVTEG